MHNGETTLRVRYNECDPMGVAHHSAYATWFEIGRTEALRGDGVSYRAVEEAGCLLAVVKIEITFKKPARYDDLLRLETTLVEASRVKILHEYKLWRDGVLLATGGTMIACTNQDGRAVPLPEMLRIHVDRQLQSAVPEVESESSSP